LDWRVRGRGSRLVVVEVENVLLEVADPVLLHRERTLELHLTEPGGESREHTVLTESSYNHRRKTGTVHGSFLKCCFNKSTDYNYCECFFMAPGPTD
jgi:hypothetical protein